MSIHSSITNPDLPAAGTDLQATLLRLQGWSCIRAEGPDCDSFLQGQLSADLRKLSPERASWAGYNSPKGRLLAVLLLVRTPAGVDLWLPTPLLGSTLERLRMFVMRAKLSLRDGTTEQVALGLLGSDPQAWLGSRQLPAPAAPLDVGTRGSLHVLRAAGTSPRYLLLASPEDLAPWLGAATMDESLWRRADIESGVPVVMPETQDRWVAQMVNLDLMGGVSFDKGCYTGQEVVARLHYLGNLKKRLFRLRGAGPAPAPGTGVLEQGGDGQAVGEIVDAVAAEHGYVATAVLQLAKGSSPLLRLDRADDSAIDVPTAVAPVAA